MFVRHVAVDRNKSSLAGVFGRRPGPPAARVGQRLRVARDGARAQPRHAEQASMMAVNNIW